MEIINKEMLGEQPVLKDEQTCVQEEQNELVQQSLQSGSPSKKFKTVDSLLKAYESLEKEFTKKCQLVKELENSKAGDNTEKVPQYALQDWQSKVSEFFMQNPKAKQYVDEISNILSSDKDIAIANNSLEQAYLQVLKNNFKSKEELIADQEFVNQYILTNEKIKQTIIQEYLNQVQNRKTAPLFSGGGNSAVTSKQKPVSINQAGELAKALFKI